MAEKRRGRPADHSSEETRAAIVATAQRLFGEAGYPGVSMERIAAECGLTVRAIYHYVPSKRALFTATTQHALERFGAEVLARVFVHDRLEDRVRGYLDVYRALHAGDPDVVPFIGMVLVDAIAADGAGTAPATVEPGVLDAGTALRDLLGSMVDDAIASGEVSDAVDREGAITLLVMLGRGLSLSALQDADTFPAMLDALQLLVEGTLFVPAVAPATDKK